MKHQTKDEYLKALRTNPSYSAVLKKASTKEERQKIINTVEYIVGNLFDVIHLAMGQMNSDPAIEKQIFEALKTGDGIIKESDGSPVGSNKNQRKEK
jgi:hypothetical protein